MFYEGKQNKDTARLFCLYLFICSYLDDMSYFLALVDMNYLIAISVDKTIEANYRIILSPFTEAFLFLLFSFSILTEKQQMSF